MEQTEPTSGIGPALYLIPTGLSDCDPSRVIPPYNTGIVSRLRHFVVENVRTARRWIRKCDPSFSFEGVEFAELNTRTPAAEVDGMLAPLRRGESMGVMSEAGCPAIADPGADIVAAAQAEGFKVVPLVGPSSILMSLMGSGFNGQSFCFHGYLPIDDKERRLALQKLERESAKENRTQIFIETPYRNDRLLSLLAETLLPDTKVCVAVDITGSRESIVTRTAADWKRLLASKKEAGEKHDKLPAIFLLYRGNAGRADSLIYSTKGRGKKR